MNKSKLIKNCQVCKSKNLQSIIFLGYLPPVNLLHKIGTDIKNEEMFPLELVRCKSCGLVQINLEVSKEILFPFEYPYLSGTTKVLTENFKDLFNEVKRLKLINKDDLVLDIGSNDGSLLSNFHNNGFKALGIEPSKAAKVAISKGINTINEYFTKKITVDVKKKFGFVKILTAANVFAHISNPKELIENIVSILDKDGVFISESHYLPTLLKTVQYDTIYHEHLRYYHLDSLRKLFEYEGLKIFYAKKIKTHGGSIRVYASKSNKYKMDKSVKSILKEEANNGIIDGSALFSLKNKIVRSKLDLLSLISSIKSKKKRIFGIGAPSRASTLISYLGIDDGIIDCVLEVSNSHKINCLMPGTKIPILDEKKLFKEKPDYVLLLSWHISSFLIKILRKKGFRGKFIIPLPKPKIIG